MEGMLQASSKYFKFLNRNEVTLKINFIVTSFFFTSCAGSFPFFQWNKNEDKLKKNGYVITSNYDYQVQLEKLDKFFKVDPENKIVSLSKESNNYLLEIIERIISSNELFFTSKAKPSVTIIKDKKPYHFSLPGLRLYLSDGLIKKFARDESLLICIFVYELIRSDRNLYRKISSIPIGIVSALDIVYATRVSVEGKVEIHKWAYYMLNRIGVDSDVYLTWLQIQNRNSTDFSYHLGDINSISKEEAYFKSYLINNLDYKRDLSKISGSSKNFYSFLKELN
jgi:hypothetical protein